MRASISYSIRLNSFLVNNFADFPDVWVKTIKILSSRWLAFCYSNISYWGGTILLKDPWSLARQDLNSQTCDWPPCSSWIKTIQLILMRYSVRIPCGHRLKTGSPWILTKTTGWLFNSTVLCGHSEERGQGLYSCTASVLSDVSHNPMSDVNIGQNGQLRSSFLNGLNPPLGSRHWQGMTFTHCMIMPSSNSSHDNMKSQVWRTLYQNFVPPFLRPIWTGV